MDEEKDMEEQQPELAPENNTNNNETVEKKGFNITSMILGIVSAIFCFTSYSIFVALPCSIIAIIFSVAGKKEAGRGMGIAGMVLGIISLVIVVIIFIMALLLVGSFATAFGSSLN